MGQGGATISGLHGPGGIGKTALALKVAEALAPHYPDAQIDLDLRGVSAAPMSPGAVMAHVIRAFYPMEKLSEGEAELGAMYRSVLHGKRVLLLFDNARDRAQDRRSEGVGLDNMGNAYAELGELRRAVELHEQQLAISHEIGDRQVEASGSWNLGRRYMALGEPEMAMAAMQVYVDYLHAIGHATAEQFATYVDVLRARLKG